MKILVGQLVLESEFFRSAVGHSCPLWSLRTIIAAKGAGVTFLDILSTCLSPQISSSWVGVFLSALVALSDFHTIQNLDGQTEGKLHY